MGWVHGWRRALAGGALVLAAACAPPDTPPALATRLPDAVLALLQPDTVRRAPVGSGVWYRYLWSPRGPWAVHLVEADLSRCDLGLAVLRALPREEGGQGHETVTSMVLRDARFVLAAVNGDFFTREGTALGTEIVGGRVATLRERPAIAWRRGADPWVGRIQAEDSVVAVGWLVPRRDGDGGTEVVSGFPELLDRGRRVGDLEVGRRPGFAAGRHPRTAVGFDADRDRLWLVVVDGRQTPHSDGMTLPELAELMEALGAEEALNLDGGGSSVMVVRGRPRNRPSDRTGERPVVNALALIRTPEGCRPTSPP